jgi:ribose transport system permease protein
VVSLGRNIGSGVLAKQGILIAFVIFMIGFTIANERFLTPDNVMGVVRSSAILGVMALGVTFVVISGNLDLSVGSMMSFSTIVVLDLHDKIGPALAIPAMFAMTLCLGAFIGFLVGYLKLNSLIVTLGMLSAIHGLTLTYSGGKNMDIADKEGTWFSVFGQGSALGIPVPILIFGLLAALLGMVLAKTPFGRKVYAVGGNGVAATFSGHPQGEGGVHLLPAFGLLRRHRRTYPGQPEPGKPEHGGAGAGTRGSGRGHPRRCIAAGWVGHDLQDNRRRLILGFIQNGLLLVGLQFYAQYVVTWVIIILAVWLDIAAKRGKPGLPIA